MFSTTMLRCEHWRARRSSGEDAVECFRRRCFDANTGVLVNPLARKPSNVFDDNAQIPFLRMQDGIRLEGPNVVA